MTEWVKPKHNTFPVSAWWRSGWGKRDHVKVPIIIPLLKLHPPPSRFPFKFLLALLKSPIYNNKFTQFDTLTLEIIHNIDTSNFSLVHHDKFKKVLARITQKNPLLHSTRCYNLNYLPFDYPTY